MKNVKKLKREELKHVIGGALPVNDCMPCDAYCKLPEGERPPCHVAYIVAHCNSCKDYGTES